MTQADPKDIVRVQITLESGCDPKDGEYTWSIIGLLGNLNPSDIDLIQEQVMEQVAILALPDEGQVFVSMSRSGEWENQQQWLEYFVTDEVKIFDGNGWAA